MKNLLLFLLLILGIISLQAQPNIQHSIYFKEKFCRDSLYAPQYSLSHSKGGKYMTYQIGIPGVPAFSKGVILAKLDNNWDTIWTKLYNGPWDEYVDHILELPNGNILLAGITESDDGGIMYGYSYKGREIWLVEVDTFGTFIKAKTIGGGNGSELTDISISSDGYIYFAGNTIADDYDFAHVVVGGAWEDVWIAKYDTAFNKVWIKVFAGDGGEGWPTIKEINPSKFIVGFGSDGTNAAMVGGSAKGLTDLVVYCIDNSGNEIWKNRYGGSNHDATQLSAIDPITKDIYFVSSSYSGVGGDITWYSGNCWIHKIDTLGNIKASKAYGPAINIAYNTDAIWYNNKLWVFARSAGGGGDMDTNLGLVNTYNAWIALIDTNANLVAKYTLASEYHDQFSDAFINNGDLMVNGYVVAPFCPYKCDTINSFGFTLNLGFAPLGIYETNQLDENLFTIYPNPTENTLFLKIVTKYAGENAELKVLDIEGRTVYRESIKHLQVQEQIECSTWKAGIYTVQIVIGKTRQWSEKFTKQ